MKTKIFLSLLFSLLFFSILNSQKLDYNFEAFKCSKSKLKKDITPYYNPLLDNYDIHFVFLDISVTNMNTSISGNVEIQATVTADELDMLILELIDELNVSSILLNEENVSFTHSNNEINIPISPALTQGENFTVKVFYNGIAVGEGISSEYSADWGKNVTWTLSETWHAREWWPCKQVMADKIDSAYIFLSVPANCKAGSNGILTNITSMGNNIDRYEWKTYHPINYYLISFAVAEYTEYNIYAYPEGHNPILIQNYIYDSPGCLDYYKEGIDNTIGFMGLFVDLLGYYPFSDEKYGHCLTEMGGAMEHQTMTSTGHFEYTTIAHELAHQWFGDYVTCESWQDIWINEGMTSYFEYIAIEHLAPTYMNEWLFYAKERALREPGGSIYVPLEDAGNERRIFNYNLSYRKGALLMHMIRHEINDDVVFYNVLKSYIDTYKNSVATGDDFLSVLNNVSEEDHSDFFNSWYYGKGYPEFTVTWQHNSDTIEIQSSQLGSSVSTPLFTMHVDYKILRNEGDTLIRVKHDKITENYKIPIKGTITGVKIDPNHWILRANSQIAYIPPQTDENDPISIYPNPVKETLNIMFFGNISENDKFYVTDLSGKVCYKSTFTSNPVSIPISELSKGLYILVVEKENESFSKKFIKN